VSHDVEVGGSQLDLLLDYLRSSRGFDFTGYKLTTLERRLKKRMQIVGAEDYASYLDRLQVDPDEFVELFNFILINVTSFFRDPEIWKYLLEEVLPELVNAKNHSYEIRVWCAGCATGEEAYSLAMAFGQLLGRDALTERVKIYATDVDENALAAARVACYGEKQLENVPEDLRQVYFDRVNGNFVFKKALRRCIIFGRHDLLQDAPISKVDLLMCRNTLMYFNSDAQAKIMSRFYFGLAEGGYLVMGKAEMMFGYNRVFVPVDLKRRIFSKGPRQDSGDGLVLMAQGGDGQALSQLSSKFHARDMAFEAGSVAQILVDKAGQLAMANARARQLFGLKRSDVGRPFQDLELSYRPVELRSLIEKAQLERRGIGLTGVRWVEPSGTQIFLDIAIMPLRDSDGRTLGAGVQFFDVSREKTLRDELEQSNHELETAIEELQSTNEELETTNEELQSTNEELETTNEELQSTNEELETMNEELQSTNEELSTTNDELRKSTSEVDQLNLFLETMMDGLNSGVIVVDSGLRVRSWNRRCYDLWGLAPEDVIGQAFLSLDIGLPVDDIGPLLLSSFSGSHPKKTTVVQAVDRRARQIQCRVTVTTMGTGNDANGAIILIDEVESVPA
jgi:two-component system, chemotaxis family, CheB/CheR fusion protein